MENNLSDKKFVEKQYFKFTGKIINWDNPLTFNEKINVFKISKTAESLWPYADKYHVRNFIKKNNRRKVFSSSLWCL